MPQANKRSRKGGKEGTCNIMIWDVPRDAKVRFKEACLKKDTSMRVAILEFMEKFSR